jgi:hypothetical protein
MQKRFFGYGSLVNRLTHDGIDIRRESVTGWRRTWAHAPGRPRSFLTVEPAPGVTIDGLSAEVPNGDWTALDLREAAYIRAEAHPGTAIYHLPPGTASRPSRTYPVVLSYIDVVIEGFLAEYGEAGVERFFQTTTGWDAPILDDRAAPRYARHRNVGSGVRHLVDRHLAARAPHVFRD